ncbi:hypothetical protein M409DRAFT_63472 [Zasmidium cellare ATCC 36951]|uniref:mRNA-capping enzyme subunit beta n=1 Tax=Zasmidium cellare ATCC 36951 TaxID=1080233 RepID=A0A6A6CXJ8_ZASCE|nr:uncharacterized protein M409DRAFT_63472 [Zasmidium cellare ATCC 36951]KAF2171937.1 hypothetical protein M409DRAFT_63472 [Zasmidium cellare ATCC 36951]
MDLAGMLNDGDAPPKRPSQTSPPASSRVSGAQVSPPAQNGSYAAGPGAYATARPSQQQTPLYGPPSAPTGLPGQSQRGGLTPLQTPSQAGGGGQYPFPQQPPLQSPATAHPGQQQQQYRGYEPYSATTPGARPPSHGYPQPSPSLGQYQNTLNAAHNASLSPTPPSHPSQTPHAMRQSPLATMGHPPPAPPHHYHQSQPNTPLGPPQLPQRHSNHQLDMSSPYHQRTFSGASNGMVSGSPAQHHPSIGNLVDSPSAYNRPSPQTRRTSDYRSSVDRERSVSVSPKTIVQPRPPSLGSRHSSQQEVYSTRGSLPPSAGVASSGATPGHVPPPTPAQAQSHHSYAASEVAQAYAQSSGSLPGPPVNGNSLSQSDNKTPLQHQSQKMGMSHLLAPTQHAQPQQQPSIPNGAPTMPAKMTDSSPSQSQSHSQPPPHASAPPLSHSQQGHVKAEPPEAKPEIKSEPSALSTSLSHSDIAATMTAAPEVQPPPIKQSTVDMSASAAAPGKAPLKRPAEEEASAEPAAKRGRVRKYRERPIWAHLSHQNPKARETAVVPNGKSMTNLNSQPPPRAAQQNGVAGPQPNGVSNARPPQANGNQANIPPWQQNPPLDDDLIHARRVLGRWEKSLKWNVPNPSFNRAVADWLYEQLKNNVDIGTDPQEGTIEIEAKIGTLIDDNGRRCELPVMNACVIHPAAARRFRFESEMNEQEHKFMNAFLNDCFVQSQPKATKGREPIDYKHIYEVDSFRTLSKAGMAALPGAAHRRRPDRDLKLRTSTDTKTGEVRARIIKVKLGEDLHIFGAGDPYDVRISMNLEINMDRPGFDPTLLTEEPTETKRAPPNRRKDRLSYKHLAYQVDLTRVDIEGMAHKYELELEVDANVLRDQIARLEQRQPHAYTDVVDGFVSNMLMLMKQNRG